MLMPFVKVARARDNTGLGERWDRCEVSPTMNVFDNSGDTRSTILVFENHAQDSRITEVTRSGCPTLGSCNGDCLQGKNVLVLHRR